MMSETLEERYPKETGTQVLDKQSRVPQDCVRAGKGKDRGRKSTMK